MGPETKANECIDNKLSKAAVLIKYFPEGSWQFVKSGGPILFSFEAATQTECFPQDPEYPVDSGGPNVPLLGAVAQAQCFPWDL